MVFYLIRECGIEREGRRNDDGCEIRCDVMIVPGDDHHQVDQCVGDQEP